MPHVKPEACYTAVAHEVMLKGKKRGWFERRLAENLSAHVQARGMTVRIERAEGRFIIHTPHSSEADRILTRVFGVHHAWKSLSIPQPRSLDDLFMLLTEYAPREAFRLSVQRAWKDYPLTSLQIRQELGRRLAEAGLPARLDASREVRIDILRDRVLIHLARLEGPGGLPLGVTGRALCLLSGGIDSPAAAWLLMKRGVRVDFIHYHTFPENKQVLSTKIREILDVLNDYQLESHLYLQPYHEYQFRTHGRIPRAVELVAFRLYMLLQAWRIARRDGYDAICTGDNLGQVASQTMQNMRTVSLLSTAFILRPLVTYDKEEIISLAKRIGTYAASIKPYRDCCSLISPHPSTRVRMEKLEAYLPLLRELVEETLGTVERFTLRLGEREA